MSLIFARNRIITLIANLRNLGNLADLDAQTTSVAPHAFGLVIGLIRLLLRLYQLVEPSAV